MPSGNVGASILNIITESLYDKPIVVFREYVQNSVDSFRRAGENSNLDDMLSEIWIDDDSLYFLDNGNGILEADFFNKMKSIALSDKEKLNDIGYKGIGRLSGISYCEKLTFINICSYKDNNYQKYSIDKNKYNSLRQNKDYNKLEFSELMEEIGDGYKIEDDKEIKETQIILDNHKDIFIKHNTGFLVILEKINFVLQETIKPKDDFLTKLGWLLPVKFKNELLGEKATGTLFKELETGDVKASIKTYNIKFNGKMIERPIENNMLRDYTCKIDFKYAIGFHTFRSTRILIEKKNSFSGIRLYLDNMLLCDENELIPALKLYGLIGRNEYDLMQTVKGIGAVIYITDKLNISANARRTFIEITDNYAVDFLKLIAEFINKVYDARYALSDYESAKKNVETTKEKLTQFQEAANRALKELAKENIDLPDEPIRNFEDLDEIDRKSEIKKKLIKYANEKIREYLLQTSDFDYQNTIKDFLTWLKSNN